MISKKMNHTFSNYACDNYGKQIYEKNEYGYVSKATYDVFGNMLSETQVDAKFSYDARGNMLSASNDTGTITKTYDAFDQLTESKKHIDDELTTTTYKYDVFGNQTVSSSKDGTTNNTYNSKGN